MLKKGTCVVSAQLHISTALIINRMPVSSIHCRHIIFTDYGVKIMIKWEHINNKRSHSHLSYSHSRPIPISFSNLVPIPMRIPRKGWEFRISHSHAYL